MCRDAIRRVSPLDGFTNETNPIEPRLAQKKETQRPGHVTVAAGAIASLHYYLALLQNRWYLG